MAEKKRLDEWYNPFPEIERQQKKAAQGAKKPAPKPAPKKTRKVEEEDGTWENFSGTLGEGFRKVGDFLRGVKRR